MVGKNAFILLICFLVVHSEDDEYRREGCYQDRSDRAISGEYSRFIDKTVHKCYLKAKLHGYEIFAVEDNTYCYTSKDAYNTFYKYGISDDCFGGTGGKWAMDVYQIHPNDYHLLSQIKELRKENKELRKALEEHTENATEIFTTIANVTGEVDKNSNLITAIYWKMNEVIRFLHPKIGTDNGTRYIWGYVEIFHENEWGSICDDRFDDRDADVVCRTGGYSNGTYDHGSYKQNYEGIKKSHRIWLDDVMCKGNERNVDQCTHNPWGQNNCERYEDVGIKCFV